MQRGMSALGVLAIAGSAFGQMQSSAWRGSAGEVGASPAGEVVYDNSYDGTSTFGNAAQKFESTFAGYDVWLGDDFSTDQAYGSLNVSSVGFCGQGCVDPFQIQSFDSAIFDGLPNDPDTQLLCESTDWAFNGIDAWEGQFEDCCLPAGEYMFAFLTCNSFQLNGQVYFFQQNETQKVDNGWQWNSGGAFGWPDDLQYLEGPEGGPASPNALILGATCNAGGCYGDCDGNGELNILDFVCFQGLFQAGDAGADCDGNGELNILDFVCFQGEFNGGC